jgi:hypothetical protein
MISKLLFEKTNYYEGNYHTKQLAQELILPKDIFVSFCPLESRSGCPPAVFIGRVSRYSENKPIGDNGISSW